MVARGALAQTTTQDLHNEREPINPHEAVAVGEAAHAANSHRANRRLNSQRERAKRTLSSSMLDATVFSWFEEMNMDYFRNPMIERHCDSSTDTQEHLNRKEPNRFINPDKAVFQNAPACCDNTLEEKNLLALRA